MAAGLLRLETNSLVDLDHANIVDVEPTTAIRQAEVTATKRMIERTRERFDLYPARLAADTGYGSAAMLGWLVYEHGIGAACERLRQVGASGRHIRAGCLYL